MVRLKVSDEAYSEKITGISIPYGAIKSLKIIPFECIKNSISIPYGAIKSFSFLHILYLQKKFQFLMVRLKEITKNSTKVAPANFNSLWCD